MNEEKDVEHNKVYHTNWRGILYLVLYDSGRIGQDYWMKVPVKNDPGGYGTTGAFSKDPQFTNYKTPAPGIEVREATPIEDRWLRNCIQMQAFTPCPEDVVINNYQIF